MCTGCRSLSVFWTSFHSRYLAIVQTDKNRAEMRGVFPSTSTNLKGESSGTAMFSIIFVLSFKSETSEQFCDFGLHGWGPEAAHWECTVVSRTRLASNILQSRVKITDVMKRNTEMPLYLKKKNKKNPPRLRYIFCNLYNKTFLNTCSRSSFLGDCHGSALTEFMGRHLWLRTGISSPAPGCSCSRLRNGHVKVTIPTGFVEVEGRQCQ